MRNLVVLIRPRHGYSTLVRLSGPGGIRSVAAESVLVKQQLLTLNRSRQRSHVKSLNISIRNGQEIFFVQFSRISRYMKYWRHTGGPSSADLFQKDFQIRIRRSRASESRCVRLSLNCLPGINRGRLNRIGFPIRSLTSLDLTRVNLAPAGHSFDNLDGVIDR
jgi:hypothetical protein